CVTERTELDIAEILLENCDMGELGAWDIAHQIHVEDDADGPGYKDLDFYFQGEAVAHQMLVEVHNSCSVEENFEYYCPEK
ncbi:MAG: hypothetical protein AAF202_11025, partial [Pseudomonadota bacterium]